MEALQSTGERFARNLTWLPSESASWRFTERCHEMGELLRPALKPADTGSQKTASYTLQTIRENLHLIESELDDVCRAFAGPSKIPHVRTPEGKVVPRCLALAERFLRQVDFVFTGQALNSFVSGFQQVTVLKAIELALIVPALKLALLEEITALLSRGAESTVAQRDLNSAIRSLRVIRQTNWKDVLDPLILFDNVLRQDPAEAYPRMDSASRELYRSKVVEIADRSDCTELEVAGQAIALAREAQQEQHADPRVRQRRWLLLDGRGHSVSQAARRVSSSDTGAGARLLSCPPG